MREDGYPVAMWGRKRQRKIKADEAEEARVTRGVTLGGAVRRWEEENRRVRV